MKKTIISAAVFAIVSLSGCGTIIDNAHILDEMRQGPDADAFNACLDRWNNIPECAKQVKADKQAAIDKAAADSEANRRASLTPAQRKREDFLKARTARSNGNPIYWQGKPLYWTPYRIKTSELCGSGKLEDVDGILPTYAYQAAVNVEHGLGSLQYSLSKEISDYERSAGGNGPGARLGISNQEMEILRDEITYVYQKNITDEKEAYKVGTLICRRYAGSGINTMMLSLDPDSVKY
jgi:hypothetical protein